MPTQAGISLPSVIDFARGPDKPTMSSGVGVQPFTRPQYIATSLKAPLIVAIAYYLGAEAAFYIGTLSDKIFALFWPPNVVLFCALLVVPERRWWALIAAAFPAHVAAELGVGMPLLPLLVAFATNCMVALLNAVAVRRVLGGPPWLGSLGKACKFTLITAGASPALSALGEPPAWRRFPDVGEQEPGIVGVCATAPTGLGDHAGWIAGHRLCGRVRGRRKSDSKRVSSRAALFTAAAHSLVGHSVRR